MANYYCKYCGTKNPTIAGLVNGGCSRSPSKKHGLYEGSEKSKYFCKYCGVANSSIAGRLRAGGARKAPQKDTNRRFEAGVGAFAVIKNTNERT
jgi:hypothetical protein